MAQSQNQLTLSIFVAAAYAAGGIYFFNVYPEYALLASVLVVIAGMLPDIDGGDGVPVRELGGLLAAVSPLVVLEFFPSLKAGGVARLALVVICCYLITRIVVVRGLLKLTSPRGVIHSIPAAIISFEAVYLLFWDVYWKERLFIALAAFCGYMAHLLLEAFSNLDLVGKAMGNASKKAGVLKLGGPSWQANLVVYAGMIYLGWHVVNDLYPHVAPRLG